MALFEYHAPTFRPYTLMSVRVRPPNICARADSLSVDDLTRADARAREVGVAPPGASGRRGDVACSGLERIAMPCAIPSSVCDRVERARRAPPRAAEGGLTCHLPGRGSTDRFRTAHSGNFLTLCVPVVVAMWVADQRLKCFAPCITSLKCLRTRWTQDGEVPNHAGARQPAPVPSKLLRLPRVWFQPCGGWSAVAENDVAPSRFV